MIHENNPANPVGMYGQQSATGETLLMKYSAMFMAILIKNKELEYERFDEKYTDISGFAQHSINLARTLITELNKEIKPANPVPQHEVSY